MEEKLLAFKVLRTKKARTNFNPRNASYGTEQKYHSKLFKHSKCDVIFTSQNKAKNVLELPKSTVEIFNALEKLNAEKTINQSLELSSTSKVESSPDKRICDKMESNENKPAIIFESNNTEDRDLHSLKTKNPKEKLNLDQSSQKGKTEGFDNENLMHRNKTGKHILRKGYSEGGIMNSFEEFGSSDPIHEVNSSTLIITNIPATVREWINHLPSNNSSQSYVESTNIREDKSENMNTAVMESTYGHPSKLRRDTPLQSSSSLDSLLESRRPDPVEIFLNLGFGGVPGVDMEQCRIPKRFLVPSKCKGGDWNEFLRRELIQAQNFECSSLGFRGLSGPSYRRPSAIVANIMEKLRERSISQTKRPRFSTVVKRVLNEKNTENKICEFQSVLSPDSREFLQNQGKISPEVPRRRIIFGQKSFAFSQDGELVEVESAKTAETTNVTTPKSPAMSQTVLDAMADNLVKLRRCGLQKQKNVYEDLDVDTFYILGNEEKSVNHDDQPEKTSNCSRNESKEIPRRFLSISSLEPIESETDLSEMMRLEIKKEIRNLSEKIKNLTYQELVSVLTQVKKITSSLENAAQVLSDE